MKKLSVLQPNKNIITGRGLAHSEIKVGMELCLLPRYMEEHASLVTLSTLPYTKSLSIAARKLWHRIYRKQVKLTVVRVSPHEIVVTDGKEEFAPFSFTMCKWKEL